MDDLERQRQLRRLRDESLNVPNCRNCLRPMEPVSVDGGAYWRCEDCGTTLDSV